MSGHATAQIYETVVAQTAGTATWSQSLEFYYKIGDASMKPEWHGNLLVTTPESNVFDGKTELNLGFLLKLGEGAAAKEAEDPNWQNGWDGVDCRVIIDTGAPEDVILNGYDVFHVGDDIPDSLEELYELR